MKKVTFSCLGILTALCMQAQIIHVPGDYATIQFGINAANPGDTILVAEGLYYEQINFLGKKPLMVSSEFLMDNDASHIANTIIDGSQLTNPDSASVVYFISGEDTTSVLCGFTVQNGKGTFIPDEFGDWDSRVGGGIWIAGSGAKIVNNRITHNTLDDTQDPVVTNVNGAGIGTSYEDANFWLVITDNTIDSNYCISNHYQASGAGISSSYSTRLINNVISYNVITGQLDAVAVGCGFGIAGELGWINPLILIAEDNTITHNISQSGSMANSAGVLVQAAQVIFRGNEVSENSVTDGLDIEFSGGGGMFLLNPQLGSVISNNVFNGNSSNRFSGAIHLKNFDPQPIPVLFENNYFTDNEAKYGGALSSMDVPVILQNNVFMGNYAQGSGGAILLGEYEGGGGHFATIINNSFSGNKAVSWAGAIYSPYNPKILILNSVFWADSATTNNEIHSSDTIEIAYSDINLDEVYGNVFDGGGNIDMDPLFDDLELLTLTDGSPCINGGADSFTCLCGIFFSCPEFDLNGISRPQNEYVDIGAYENAFTNIWDHPKNNALSFSVYPNPMNDNVSVDYEVEKEAVVNIFLYSTTGKKLKSYTWQINGTGRQHFEFNVQDLLPGIYFLSIQAGDETGSGKVVKL